MVHGLLGLLVVTAVAEEVVSVVLNMAQFAALDRVAGRSICVAARGFGGGHVALIF